MMGVVKAVIRSNAIKPFAFWEKTPMMKGINTLSLTCVSRE